MDIRNEFKNQGECYFPIKSIDEEFHNYLSEHYKCNETKNLHDMWTNQDDNGFRFDTGEIIEQGKEVHHVVEHGSFDELELKKNELVEKYKEEKYKDWKCHQLWYYNTTPKPIITTGINNIVRYLYDLDDDAEFSEVDQVLLTLYNEHCRFVQHSDGPQAGYMCSVVIYLNENYDVSRGGLFDGEQKYIPEFGMCVVQDLLSHDLLHGVTKVTSGERYALLSFPTLKGTIVSSY